jgi:hypothetical protein
VLDIFGYNAQCPGVRCFVLCLFSHFFVYCVQKAIWIWNRNRSDMAQTREFLRLDSLPSFATLSSSGYFCLQIDSPSTSKTSVRYSSFSWYYVVIMVIQHAADECISWSDLLTGGGWGRRLCVISNLFLFSAEASGHGWLS